MDPTTLEMVLTAYDETYRDALSAGRGDAIAHKEGVTAAAMCLAACCGVEDAAARAQVEAIDFRAQLAA